MDLWRTSIIRRKSEQGQITNLSDFVFLGRVINNVAQNSVGLRLLLLKFDVKETGK